MILFLITPSLLHCKVVSVYTMYVYNPHRPGLTSNGMDTVFVGLLLASKQLKLVTQQKLGAPRQIKGASTSATLGIADIALI